VRGPWTLAAGLCLSEKRDCAEPNLVQPNLSKVLPLSTLSSYFAPFGVHTACERPLTMLSSKVLLRRSSFCSTSCRILQRERERENREATRRRGGAEQQRGIEAAVTSDGSQKLMPIDVCLG